MGPLKNSDPGPRGKTIRLIKNKFTDAEDYLSKKYDFRRNILSLEIEIRNKGDDHETYRPVNENSLYRELQHFGNTISLANIVAILRSDFVTDFDPIRTYFEGLKWDQQSHIDKLADYVKANEPEEWKNHFKKHIVRTVRCAIDNDYFNKQALIIVHPSQNSGKSTFIRFLCPPELAAYIAEDVTTDKDSRILLVKNFIINLDELDKLNKQEIAAVKSFISKNQINERLPFDRKNSVLKRRASFFGSTNKEELLDDPTGSVRWLCFEIASIDWNYKSQIDINQVWAEAYILFKSGFNCDLTREELERNEERNKQFQVLSIERQLIEKLFEPDPERLRENFKTTTEVFDTLVGLTNLSSRLNVVQIGKALNMLKFPKGKETKERISGYYLKLKDFTN